MKMGAGTTTGIDLILPTFNRPGALARCLRSIAAGARNAPSLKIRVLALVNGPDPGSKELLRAYSQEFSGVLELQLLESATTRVPGEARNLLLEKSSSEWLYFVDDDCELAADVFQEFLKTVQLHPSAEAIGGPNLNPPGSSAFQNLSGDVLGSPFGSGPYRRRYRASEKPEIIACDERSLISCNLFIRAESALAHRFPAEVAAGEENELLMKLGALGKTCLYNGRLVVFHERRGSFRSLCAQMFKYGKGRGILVVKTGKRYWEHTLGFLAISSAVLLPFIAFFGAGWAWTAFQLLFLGYGGFALVAAFSIAIARRRPALSIVPLLPIVVAVHLCYVSGMVAGAVSLLLDPVRMKRKTPTIANALLLASVLALGNGFSSFAAEEKKSDARSAQREADKYSKDISKLQKDIAERQAELKTEQAKLDEAKVKHGADSVQYRNSEDRVKRIQKDLAEMRADLMEKQAKRQIEAGEAAQGPEASS